MKEQFTQGDWKANDWSSHGDWGVESGGLTICCGFGANKENEANAHLIAAAPKMYEMLQEWVMHVDNGDTDHAIINEHVAIITRELLAEARGETT